MRDTSMRMDKDCPARLQILRDCTGVTDIKTFSTDMTWMLNAMPGVKALAIPRTSFRPASSLFGSA